MDLFYRCAHCGNLVYVVLDGSVTPQCCGEAMKLLKAGEVEAAVEKHLPEVFVNGDDVSVKVGSVEHPMTPEHSIQWIALVINGKVLIQKLTPDMKPEAVFTVKEKGTFSVYEFCNLHGLWKTTGEK